MIFNHCYRSEANIQIWVGLDIKHVIEMENPKYKEVREWLAIIHTETFDTIVIYDGKTHFRISNLIATNFYLSDQEVLMFMLKFG